MSVLTIYIYEEDFSKAGAGGEAAAAAGAFKGDLTGRERGLNCIKPLRIS